jgi:predicted aconitase with swiveling domain
MKLKGRKVVGGIAEGESLVSKDPVSFYGGVNPFTGCVTEPGHCCCGENISGKIFIFPSGKGSSVGSYVIYRMKKLGTAPSAIINIETEAIIVTGCVMGEIPLIDKLNQNPLKVIKNGSFIHVDAYNGILDVLE